MMIASVNVNTPLLTVRGLRKGYQMRAGLLAQLFNRQGETIWAVDGVDLDLQAGEVLGLVGESGSGKTTLGRLLTRLETPTAGEIHLMGQNIFASDRATVAQIRRQMQMIFQNPYESLDPRYTVNAWVSEPLNLLGLGDAAERRERVLEVLNAVGLRPIASYLDRFPHELSGGQRQRVDIARALVVRPQLLVADEPVSMLDVSVSAGILKLLLSLKEEFGIAYIFIGHDLAVARYVSDRIAVMYLGRIVEQGPTEQVIAQPAHPYTRLLLAAVPDIGTARKRQRVRLPVESATPENLAVGCRFRARCPLARPICETDDPPLLAVGDGHLTACHFRDEVVKLKRLPVAPMS